MRRLFYGLIIAMLILPLAAEELQWLPGRFIICFYPETRIDFNEGSNGMITCGIPSVDSLLAEYRVHSAKRLVPLTSNPRIAGIRYPIRNWFLVFADVDSATIPGITAAFEKCRDIDMASPDHLFPKFRVPNDPMYSAQWFHDKLNMSVVWDFNTNIDDVLITVMEGVQWHHPDLNDNIWVNPGEDLDGDGVPMDPDDMNGIDDDENGYDDDLIGWDFINNENDPDDDDSGHGTMCSGTIGAVGNNSIGVCGMTWDIQLVVLKTDDDSMHIQSAIVPAISYGMEMGVDIYSLSYGGYTIHPLSRALYQSANDNGAVLIGAAGNENVDTISYPAGYTFVLAVGATDQNDERTYFSNFGDWVDICAPGEYILTTRPTDDYESVDGTSFSCPIAAGVAAFLVHVYPDSSPDFIYERMRIGVDNIDSLNPGFEGLLGTGRIDAAKALYQWRFPFMLLDSFVIIDSDGDGRVTHGEQGELIIYYRNDPEWQVAEDIELTVSCSDEALEFSVNTVNLGDISPGGEVDNESLHIIFEAQEEYFEGHPVEFTLHLSSGSSEYVKNDYIEFMLSYPSILLYECDGYNRFSNYLNKTLTDGKVIHEHWIRDSIGTITADLLDIYFQTVIVMSGNTETDILSESEISLFEDFMDDGGNMLLSGQYLPDDLAAAHSDFLEDYFGAVHENDAENRMWGLHVNGIEDDIISDGMDLKCITSGDAADNQVSFGTCYETGTGIGFLRYQMDTDENRFAAIRNEFASGGKTAFIEFGLEGVHNLAVGYTYRDSLVANIMRWFGHEYEDIREDKAIAPERIRLIAHPNPFNSKVEIEFNASGDYAIDIFDFSGKFVKSIAKGSGNGRISISWDGTDSYGHSVPTGVYLVVANSIGKTATSKVILMK